jgi:hypothetical protein
MLLEASMSSSRWRPYFAITTFKIFVVGLVVLAVGIGLIYVGGEFPHYWKLHEGADSLVDNLGALLVISVALGLIWELVGKRAFAREVLETINAATDLEKAGIDRVGTGWLQDPDWADLFQDVRELDIFVAYGSTWRNAHLGQLQALANRANAHIHVYLADPGDEATVRMLSARFNQTPNELRQRVSETKEDFLALRSLGRANVEVFYYPGDRVFSFYRFDNRFVMTLYRHAKGRSAIVPTLVCSKGGTFFEFLQSELDAIRSQSSPASSNDAPGVVR